VTDIEQLRSKSMLFYIKNCDQQYVWRARSNKDGIEEKKTNEMKGCG